MQNKLASGARLGRQALLFPLCLVLYEFSTYIGNDMIQPGMLAVVEQYQAGIDWVPTSMTAYLAGGMFLCWHRLWSGSLLMVLAVVIAWSRVYLGVHWPLDMLGGLLAGMIGCLSAQIIWQAMGHKLYQRLQSWYRFCFVTDPQRLGA